MAHANRGTKRRCPHCGAAYYDLDRTPVVCPKCQTPYVESRRLPVRTPGRAAKAEEIVVEHDEEAAAFAEDDVLDHVEDEEAITGDDVEELDEPRD